MTTYAHIPTADLITELARCSNLSLEQTVDIIVAEHHHLTPADLHTPTRRLHIVRPRQLAMTILRNHGRTLHSIADHYHLDHGTVVHAVKTIRKHPHLQTLCTQLAANLQTA